ncbi:hypothetical protein BJX70DRAFT_390230 [Aspergillus crustosus]
MQDDELPSSKPSPVACISCRGRHVKCDALIPACTRCRTNNIECHYIRSRRGLWKSKNISPQTPSEEDIASSTETDLDWLITTAFPSEGSIDTTQNIPLVSDDALINLSELELVTPEVAYDPMVQLYYHNFHPSHPIMISRKALNTPLCYLIPSQIISIIRYIGAHYYPNTLLRESLRQAAFSFLSDPSLQAGFRVQALLLVAIIEHSYCHDTSAHSLLHSALDLALELGMNLSGFAREHSYGHSVLEEVWHRTYWELYTLNGLFAAMQGQSLFRLYSQETSVQVPCSDKTYTYCNTHEMLNDFGPKIASGQDFSSFAHRINAVQILGAVLELNRFLEADIASRVEILDAQISSSLMALPPLYPDGYGSSCHDEMIFQAQMILYLATIYLHHPHSSLRFASITTPSSTPCTQLNTISTADLVTSHPPPHLDLYSHKLLRAADHLSSLASLPSAIHFRTPFFTCALAMCVAVHTAALLVTSDGNSSKKEPLKARIQLGIGALKALGRIWPLAEIVRRQMAGMYREIIEKDRVV